MSSTIVLVPLFILMIIICTAIPILLAIFVYRDAKARGMEPLLWTLLAVFAPGFIGLIVYLVVRRDHFKLICPQCGNEVQQGFVSCPNCGQKLSANCSHCGTALRPEWNLCPQCGSEVTSGQPFLPPMVMKPQTKGMGVAIAAILALPLAFVFFMIVGFLGVRSYTTYSESHLSDEVYYEKARTALESFRQASDYVDLEVLTLDDAELNKEELSWVKEKQKGKEGIYSATFSRVEEGSIHTEEGSGSYALTYDYTVVVVNSIDGKAYAPSGYDFTHCLGVEEALLIENVTVSLGSDKNSGMQSSDYGNVFVIKHAYGYAFDYQHEGDDYQTYYEAVRQKYIEFSDDENDLNVMESYDYSDVEPYYIHLQLLSDGDDKGVTYEIPIKYDGEFYAAFKK